MAHRHRRTRADRTWDKYPSAVRCATYSDQNGRWSHRRTEMCGAVRRECERLVTEWRLIVAAEVRSHLNCSTHRMVGATILSLLTLVFELSQNGAPGRDFADGALDGGRGPCGNDAANATASREVSLNETRI
jgi:hypothetical protein